MLNSSIISLSTPKCQLEQLELPFHLKQRVWAKFACLNKLNTLQEYYQECNKINGFRWQQCRIDTILQLTSGEYETFSNAFLSNSPFLTSKLNDSGGTYSDSIYLPDLNFQFATEEQREDWYARSFCSVALVTAPERTPFVVDTQGYAYARYVGIDIRESQPEEDCLANLIGSWLKHTEEDKLAVPLHSVQRSTGHYYFFGAIFNLDYELLGEGFIFVNTYGSSWSWLYEDQQKNRLSLQEIKDLACRLEEVKAERLALQAQKEAEAEARRAANTEKFLSRRPAWAKAYIFAELHEDESDLQSDYFDSTIKRRVFLAWSKAARNSFPEMRKAAALFPPTTPLVNGPEDYEHRENYSGGAGYYLAEKYIHKTQWVIRKLPCPGDGQVDKWAIALLEWDVEE